MDSHIPLQLQANTDTAHKAAIIAEATLSELPQEIAQIAYQCIILHWFDLPVLTSLHQDAPESKYTPEYMYEQMKALPFIEHLVWGLAFQDATRDGLLKHFIPSREELVRTAARLAVTAYERAGRENRKIMAEALFCHIIAGNTKFSVTLMNKLLEQAVSHHDWQHVRGLLQLQEEAERLPFVQPLPLTERYWMLLGIYHRTQNQVGKAMNAYTNAIAMNPRSVLAHINRGTIYTEQKSYMEALAEYEQALLIDPDNTLASYGKAAILNEIGKYSEAANGNEQAQVIEQPFIASLPELRKTLGLSKIEVARGLHLGVDVWNKLETGAIELNSISQSQLERLAHFFQISTTWFGSLLISSQPPFSIARRQTLEGQVPGEKPAKQEFAEALRRSTMTKRERQEWLKI